MGRRSGTLNVLSQHWKHSKAAVTAVRHARATLRALPRRARGFTLHFLLHTRLPVGAQPGPLPAVLTFQ